MLLTTFALATTLLVTPTDTLILKGEPIGKVAAIPMATVLASPAKYTTTPVVIEGVIVRSCTEQGCWMQLAPTKADEGVRVDFEHKFLIPLTAAGMKARAKGVVTMKTLTKEQADHAAHEGAKLKRNADGTAYEVGFKATGVELSN